MMMAMMALRGQPQQQLGRAMSTVAKLPDLPYNYSALEPYISGNIMELHHSKHHAAYVANYNKAVEQYADADAKGDIPKMIALQGALKFNGGGEASLGGQGLRRDRCALVRDGDRNPRPPHPGPGPGRVCVLPRRPRQPCHLLEQPDPTQGKFRDVGRACRPGPALRGVQAEGSGPTCAPPPCCWVTQDFAPPSGELKAAIEAQWKSLDNFTTTFSAQTAAVQVGAVPPPPRRLCTALPG